MSSYIPKHLAAGPSVRRPRWLRRRSLVVGGATGAVALLGGLMAGTGAFSTFTTAISPPSAQTVSSGTVNIAFGTNTSTGDALTVSASNIAPGDTVQRGVTLNNTGTISLASVTFSATLGSGATANPLTEASATTSGGTAVTTNEMQFELQSCSVGWTATALAAGGYSYTCSGTTKSVIASEPVSTLLSTPTTVTTGLNSLSPSGTDYLVATLTLPSTVPNDVYLGTTQTAMQGLSTSLSYSFQAVQRSGQPM